MKNKTIANVAIIEAGDYNHFIKSLNTITFGENDMDVKIEIIRK